MRQGGRRHLPELQEPGCCGHREHHRRPEAEGRVREADEYRKLADTLARETGQGDSRGQVSVNHIVDERGYGVVLNKPETA